MDFPISEDGHWVDLEAHLNALDFQGRRIKAAHKSRSTADVDHAKQRKVLALKRKQSKSVPHWTDDPNPDAPKSKSYSSHVAYHANMSRSKLSLPRFRLSPTISSIKS